MSSFIRNRKKKLKLIFLLLYFILLLSIFGFLMGRQIYYDNFKVAMILSNRNGVKKGDVLKLNFSVPMNRSTVESGLAFSPPVNTQTWWENDQTLCVRMQEALYPDSDYNIYVKGAKTRWFVLQKDLHASFRSLDSPNLIYIDPVDAEENVEIKPNIVMKFDKTFGDAYRIEVKINPYPEGGFDYQLQDDKRVLTITPKGKLAYNTNYTLTARLVSPIFNDFSKNLYKETFATVRSSLVTYYFDANGNPIRTEEKKETILPQITDAKYIDVDISSQQLTLFDHGQEEGSYKVSTGKRGMDTPSGTFRVMAKARRPWSDKYKLFMPWFIQFTNEGHGLHELPEWPGGYKEGQNHLGIPVSHGCVRLGVGPAKLVYDFAEKDMPIVIHE